MVLSGYTVNGTKVSILLLLASPVLNHTTGLLHFSATKLGRNYPDAESVLSLGSFELTDATIVIDDTWDDLVDGAFAVHFAGALIYGQVQTSGIQADISQVLRPAPSLCPPFQPGAVPCSFALPPLSTRDAVCVLRPFPSS